MTHWLKIATLIIAVVAVVDVDVVVVLLLLITGDDSDFNDIPSIVAHKKRLEEKGAHHLHNKQYTI